MKKVELEDLYKRRRIYLESLNYLTDEEKKVKIDEVLNEMYEEKYEFDKDLITKVLDLSEKDKEDYIVLPYKLIVEKNNKELFFRFRRIKLKKGLLLILFLGFLASLLFASINSVIYIEYKSLNKDIDGDGISDINIDTNNDGKPDVNIDTDKDNKPNLNIDYKGNKKPTFNIDTDGDGKPDKNLVNDATDDVNSCNVNCDINGDGWPDHNYDLDGDGKPDLDIYDKEEGKVNESIDLNGDGICDIMCDDDNDGKCDRNCTVTDDDIVASGPSTVVGDSSNNLNSGKLTVIYDDSGSIKVDGLFPDDQYGMIANHPTKNFTLTNLSDFPVGYMMTFVVNKNTYTSENFKYKLTSTNQGYTSDFKTVPTETELINSFVVIPANTTQKYTITFKLEGTNEPQDYDQDKSFEGYIKIGE